MTSVELVRVVVSSSLAMAFLALTLEPVFRNGDSLRRRAHRLGRRYGKWLERWIGARLKGNN